MPALLNRETFLINLMKYSRLPYIWGGSGPVGYDCSGLVEQIYKDAGTTLPGRMNAQQMFQHLNMGPKLTIEQADLADLAFFGQGLSGITHVGLCLGYGLMYEAAHGDHTCVDAATAAVRGAMVMVNPILHRKDCVAIVKRAVSFAPTLPPIQASS